jgi:hypothetical protein
MSNISFTDYVNSTQQAKNAWNKNIKSHPDHKFSSALYFWRMTNKTLQVIRQRMEEEIAENSDIFVPNIAAEKNDAARKRYNASLEDYQQAYVARVNMAADSKIAEVDKTISKTADPSLVGLIRDLSLRTDISDREWFAIVERVNSANDYQASHMLADVAVKFGRSYKPPFDADKMIEEIEQARKELLKLSAIIDKPEKDWTYEEMVIVKEYPHTTWQQERYNRLDSAPGVAVPVKSASLIDQLKEALQISDEIKDYKSANEIRRFLYDRAQYVENKQIVSEYYRAEAEALIARAKATANTIGK